MKNSNSNFEQSQQLDVQEYSNNKNKMFMCFSNIPVCHDGLPRDMKRNREINPKPYPRSATCKSKRFIFRSLSGFFFKSEFVTSLGMFRRPADNDLVGNLRIQQEEHKDPWADEAMKPLALGTWAPGPLRPWAHACMSPSNHGPMNPWALGSMVSKHFPKIDPRCSFSCFFVASIILRRVAVAWDGPTSEVQEHSTTRVRTSAAKSPNCDNDSIGF